MGATTVNTKSWAASGLFGISFIAAAGLASNAHAASFSLTGNARVGTNLYNNLDLRSGVLPGEGNTSSYLESRFLIRPDVLIDDHFTVKSEMILLNKSFASKTSVPEGFGNTLDGSKSAALPGGDMFYVRRAYLNWASDWGVFSFGRMPKSWGLGLLYNAGDDVLDDFGTTVDRMGFQAMLGNLVIALGYEKGAENSLNNENDDADAYEVSLEYSNPESLFDVGLLYTRNVRTAISATGNSSHDLSIFTRKRMGALQLGGELASIGEDKKSNAVGVLLQGDYMPGALKLNLDLGYASASSDSAFTFHPNYQPFLIMFRQSLGANKLANARGGYAGNSAVGSAVGNGTGDGAVLVKGGVSYGFTDNTYVLGTTLGYGSLARQGTDSSKSLGVEWDLNFTQKWYDNFKTYYSFGLLFPGGAFGPSQQTAWGLQIRGALTF